MIVVTIQSNKVVLNEVKISAARAILRGKKQMNFLAKPIPRLYILNMYSLLYVKCTSTKLFSLVLFFNQQPQNLENLRIC